MDKEQELRERMEIIAAWRKDDAWDLCSEVFLDPLTDLLCSDEALARKFFTECTDEEFDLAYLSFEDLARVYDQKFAFWLLKNASRRDLNLDTWDELHTLLVNSKLWKVDPNWPNWTDEYMKQYVLGAIHKLEAEAE